MTSSIACKSFFFLIYFFIVHQTQGFSLNRNNNNVVLQNLKDNFGPIQVHYDKLIHDDCSRRTFVSTVALSASALLLSPKTAKAASTVTQTIDVSPLAHTFTVSSAIQGKDPKAKPLRENDTTRILTNARVVLIYDAGSSLSTIETILDLTAKRKAGQGAGVTPGKVKLVLPSEQDSLATSAINCGVEIIVNPKAKVDDIQLEDLSKLLDEGDVVFFYPQPSRGTFSDGKKSADTASTLRLPRGATKGGGLVSVLVNGPRSPSPVNILEDGYETCTVLWYDI